MSYAKWSLNNNTKVKTEKPHSLPILACCECTTLQPLGQKASVKGQMQRNSRLFEPDLGAQFPCPSFSSNHLKCFKNHSWLLGAVHIQLSGWPDLQFAGYSLVSLIHLHCFIWEGQSPLAQLQTEKTTIVSNVFLKLWKALWEPQTAFFSRWGRNCSQKGQNVILFGEYL